MNVRDLGGLRSGQHKLRSRVLVRASALGTLSAAGKEAIRAYAIHTVIDLRWPEEIQARPSHFATGATYVNVPVDKRR